MKRRVIVNRIDICLMKNQTKNDWAVGREKKNRNVTNLESALIRIMMGESFTNLI